MSSVARPSQYLCELVSCKQFIETIETRRGDKVFFFFYNILLEALRPVARYVLKICWFILVTHLIWLSFFSIMLCRFFWPFPPPSCSLLMMDREPHRVHPTNHAIGTRRLKNTNKARFYGRLTTESCAFHQYLFFWFFIDL